MKLKIAATFAFALCTLFSCGVGEETDPGTEATDPTEVSQSTQELQASCTGDYHPVAWCTGAVAKVRCQHDFNPNLTYGYRSVNCALTDRLCRDYGSSANCVKP